MKPPKTYEEFVRSELADGLSPAKMQQICWAYAEGKKEAVQDMLNVKDDVKNMQRIRLNYKNKLMKPQHKILFLIIAFIVAIFFMAYYVCLLNSRDKVLNASFENDVRAREIVQERKLGVRYNY